MFPELIAAQLAKANNLLDTAERVSIRNVRARCIARATEAQNAVTYWLRSGACPEERVAEVEDGLRKLSERLAEQLSDKK